VRIKMSFVKAGGNLRMTTLLLKPPPRDPPFGFAARSASTDMRKIYKLSHPEVFISSQFLVLKLSILLTLTNTLACNDHVGGQKKSDLESHWVFWRHYWRATMNLKSFQSELQIRVIQVQP
jgi:hypothetical protein